MGNWWDLDPIFMTISMQWSCDNRILIFQILRHHCITNLFVGSLCPGRFYTCVVRRVLKFDPLRYIPMINSVRALLIPFRSISWFICSIALLLLYSLPLCRAMKTGLCSSMIFLLKQGHLHSKLLNYKRVQLWHTTYVRLRMHGFFGQVGPEILKIVR
jgi:hypothetical protein